MSKRLTMAFITATGSKSTLSIDAPKADLTADGVKTVMQSIIAANLFDTKNGDLATVKGAEIITTEIKTLI